MHSFSHPLAKIAISFNFVDPLYMFIKRYKNNQNLFITLTQKNVGQIESQADSDP